MGNLKVTMRDIATELGITAATVSMALRNDARISAATRERVQATAARLGYRPDPLVSALMAQRRGRADDAQHHATLAVVSLWPNRRKAWDTDPFYRPYREGLQERAASLGYAVEIFPCNGSPDAVKSLMRVLRARGIQGMVIAQAHESFTTLPFAVESFAVAYIGNGIREPHLSRVDAALDFDFRMAWQAVRARGFKKIGLLTWSLLSAKTEGAWVAACLYAQRNLPRSQRIPPLEFEDPDDIVSIVAWVERHHLEALLTERTGLFPLLQKHFPNLALFSLALSEKDPYSGIRVGRRAIGAAAVDLVVAQLNRGERGVPAIPKRVLIEGTWMG